MIKQSENKLQELLDKIPPSPVDYLAKYSKENLEMSENEDNKENYQEWLYLKKLAIKELIKFDEQMRKICYESIGKYKELIKGLRNV